MANPTCLICGKSIDKSEKKQFAGLFIHLNCLHVKCPDLPYDGKIVNISKDGTATVELSIHGRNLISKPKYHTSKLKPLYSGTLTE
jgi:hypothetical protein